MNHHLDRFINLWLFCSFVACILIDCPLMTHTEGEGTWAIWEHSKIHDDQGTNLLPLLGAIEPSHTLSCWIPLYKLAFIATNCISYESLALKNHEIGIALHARRNTKSSHFPTPYQFLICYLRMVYSITCN